MQINIYIKIKNNQKEIQPKVTKNKIQADQCQDTQKKFLR